MIRRDGFIHADGSLKFEFAVKKQNLLQQLADAQKRIEFLEAEKSLTQFLSTNFSSEVDDKESEVELNISPANQILL